MATPTTTIDLSPQAVLLLRLHALRAGDLFYGVEALGSVFKGDRDCRLDHAYRELADNGMMEPTTGIIRFFGDPKRVYQITQVGLDLVSREQQP